MKNKEKYMKEIVEIVTGGGNWNIAIINGKPVNCDSVEKCEDCELYNKRLDCNDPLKQWAEAEYKEPEVDWYNVPVDTKILVKCANSQTWSRRYFAEYRNGYVYAFNNGSTLWSSNDASPWDCAKLAEEE